MPRSKWKNWIGSHEDAQGDGFLAMLHYIEGIFVRMIRGIVLFFVESMPDLWRQIINWIRKAAQITVRVAVRLLRVTAVASAWLVIVFVPLWIYPGFISGTWTALAIVGSVWGLRRQIKAKASSKDAESLPVIALRCAK